MVVQSGVDPSFISSGTIDVAALRTLEVEQGLFTQSAGTISLAGTLLLDRSTFTHAGTVTANGGSLSVVDGTASLATVFYCWLVALR